MQERPLPICAHPAESSLLFPPPGPDLHEEESRVTNLSGFAWEFPGFTKSPVFQELPTLL